jgi:hypothetical protein
MTSRSGPFTYDVGIDGCGPRGASLNMYAILVALAEAEKLNAIHKHGNYFKIRLHTFEKKSQEQRATGNAFPPNCHGVINTSVPGPSDVSIPNLDTIDPKHQELIYTATNLQDLVAKHVEAHYDAIMNEYKRVNTAAAANLQYATRADGTVNTAISCVTRGTCGKVMQEQFDFVMKNGAELVSFLEFHFHYDTEVMSYDITTDPSKPTFVTQKVGTDTRNTHVFDHVILAEGTTTVIPVPEELLPITHVGEPNFDDIQAFYRKHGLLSSDGSLKPDARILVTGMGPSAIDKATVGSRSAAFARHSTTDPSGSEFLPETVKEYGGAFGCISRHSGHSMATRHSYSTRWPGSTHFPLDDLIIQAAIMEGSPDALPNLVRILVAATARALGKTPAEVYPKDVSALERQNGYFDQDLVHFGATTPAERVRTEAGYLRSGVRVLIERASAAEDKSRQTAVETEFKAFMKGRDGWPWMRQLAAHNSKPDQLAMRSNADYFQAWEYFCHPFMTASPAPISHIFSGMFKHEIIRHHQASFSDLKRCPNTGKALCGGELYDCILASKIISIEGSRSHKSLAGKVKETTRGKAAFAKDRVYMMPDGKLTNATELGVAGEGFQDKNETGRTILVDQDWEDTNSHHAVAQITPTVIKHILCKAALKANGCEDPATEIHTRYKNSLPADDEYAAFTDRLKAHYEEYHALLAYVGFCTEYAGNDKDKYARAYDSIKTPDSRAQFVKDNSDLKDAKSVGTKYYAALQQTPAFNPLSKEQYFATYIDQTPEEMHRTWTGICDDLIEGRMA